MTAQIVPRPLKLNGKVISFPYLNQDNDVEPIRTILVDIEEEKSIQETVTLKYAFAVFYPHYGQYLVKHKKHELYRQICDYSQSVIEIPIEYKYRVGFFGYITNGNKMEHSFVCITELSEYETEIFFLHNELQKYKIQHYDITSTTPKILTDEELDGESSGWIVESIFTPIVGLIIATNDNENLLNWKTCREQYLLKKIEEITIELTGQIEERGILFRETVQQWLYPIFKALRGKITTNNVGKIIEVSFHTPKHIWYYFLDPTFVEILQLDEEDSFDMDGNNILLYLDIIDASPIIPLLYVIKLYDQFANAFKFNSKIDVNIENGDDIKDIMKCLVDNMNELYNQRFKKLKQQKKNKLTEERKVKFANMIDRISWRYNINTGKSRIKANVYKKRYLENGQELVSGKIDEDDL